jgi:Flp pilus assembly pilin Flp
MLTETSRGQVQAGAWTGTLPVCKPAEAVPEGTVNFFVEERGQDLVEYSLLLAFVVVSSIALLLVNMSSIVGIWTTTTQVINTGNSLAKSGSS